MASIPQTQIPRGRYGLWMVIATIASFAVVWGVVRLLGGSSELAMKGVLALAIGSFATFVPALLRIGFEHWGIAVLLAGVVRSLVSLGVAFASLSAFGGEASRPLFVAIASALGLLLLVESLTAVSILSKLDRQRTGAAATGAFKE